MIFALSLLHAISAWAAPGPFFGDFFPGGELGGPRVRAEERVYSREHAAGNSFGLSQTHFDASAPVSETWRTNAFADYDAIDSGATFSNGRLMPNRLWDVGGGVSHSHLLENGRTVGGSFTVSSPSDRPFTAGRDMGFNLNLNYRLPLENGNAWVFFLGMSNTRGFLSYVPLPGAAYFFQSGKKFRGLVGFPFLMLFWQPLEHLSFTMFYVPIRSGELRVTYGELRAFQIFAALSNRTHNYRLFDRSDSKERLFFEEANALAGVGIPLSKKVTIEFAGGQSFARRYFLAQKTTDRSGAPSIRPDNALFGYAKATTNF